jgi:hypothetical protein
VKVGDLVLATEGSIAGQLGLIIEVKPSHSLCGVDGLSQFGPTVGVLWRSGEQQRWVNPQFLKKVVDKLSD